MAGIYIHIPFCRQFCIYCDFYSGKSLAKKNALLAAIPDEMERNAGFLTDKKIRTIYIGGGTPSLCSAGELGMLIKKAGETFDTSALGEVTVEANPDDLTPQYLAALRETGANRLSIGVQSFIDSDLAWMNRRHDAATARKAVADAKKAGFSNITIDLIYGIPGMTADRWRYNLEEALSLDVPHISAYHLTFETGTALDKMHKKGETAPVGDAESEKQYFLLHETLTGAGYGHYEISNFARSGMRAVHNSNYWNGEQYLGLGPAAHSYNGTVRRWNVPHTGKYLNLLPSGGYFESEELTPDMLFDEYLMTGLRTDRGVDAGYIKERFGAQKLRHFLEHAGKFLESGYLVCDRDRYFIPSQKYLVSDGIILELFSEHED